MSPRMTENNPTLNETERIDRRSLRRVRNAAKSTVEVYLDLAKTGGDSRQKRSLEAIAVERALIADTLGELVGSDQRLGGDPAKKERIPSIREADEELFEASDQLYRRSHSKEVKNLARDLKFSIFGFGQVCYS